jgi:hypothetical protein
MLFYLSEYIMPRNSFRLALFLLLLATSMMSNATLIENQIQLLFIIFFDSQVLMEGNREGLAKSFLFLLFWFGNDVKVDLRGRVLESYFLRG